MTVFDTSSRCSTNNKDEREKQNKNAINLGINF